MPSRVPRLNQSIYGYEADGPEPYASRQMDLKLWELFSTAEVKKQDCKDQPDVKEFTLEAIGNEMIRLAKLHDAAATLEELKRNHNRSGPHVPPPEVSDRLVRYEAHLSREIDRILNRLERLQRMRKGQPLPPQVDVKIS